MGDLSVQAQLEPQWLQGWGSDGRLQGPQGLGQDIVTAVS